MKTIASSIGIAMLFCSISSPRAQQENFPVVTGPYLGQTPPGSTPELFAPGIISVEANFEHSPAVFSPDGTEVYWCTNVDWYTDHGQAGMLRLYCMRMINGRWTAPRRAPFTDHNVERPTFSPDGNSLYFEREHDPGRVEHMDIFVVHRRGDGWTEPEPLSPLINTPAIERIYCVTGDGSLYFARDPFTTREAIFVSRFRDGAFTEPEELGRSYNSPASEIALLVAPDGQYMLAAQINDHYTSDLYISYRNEDGSWSDRIVTPYKCGGFLALSPDGRYLFMLGEGIVWVSTSFVDELRPEE